MIHVHNLIVIQCVRFVEYIASGNDPLALSYKLDPMTLALFNTIGDLKFILTTTQMIRIGAET